jgi:hypothetical protein
MKSIQRALGRTALWLAFVLAAGCSHAPEAAAPTPAAEAAPTTATPADALTEKKEAEPMTLAEAEAQLDEARAQLDRLALSDGAPGSAGAPRPATAAPAPAPKGEPSRADSAEQPRRPPSPTREESSACETACKAFSSLTRASDAVCRLDTDGGKRCERARRIRDDASQRVASCGCPK